MTLVHPPILGRLGPATVPDAERRRFRRIRLDRPVMIRGGDPADPQRLPHAAQCVDASAGGVLLRLQSDHRLEPGHAIRVGLPADPHRPLRLADDLRDARVVRCLTHGDTHYLAAAFDVPAFLADAG
jgi:hypothetical protein